MQAPRFRGLPSTTVLGFTVPVATSLRSRALGLALLDRDRAGEGLLIPRCSAVHTFGMRFPLDLVFFGDGGRVVELRREVPSRSLVRSGFAESVLELPGRQRPPRRI
ncbi:MAG: DUF192 domain-containing protein [Actinomycetota bacterium]|nr:DUF192 domain-containing protein [Actinomycetota bacterium]